MLPEMRTILDAERPEPLPQRFGPFTLYDRIGRGGMAEIFLAATYTAIGHPKRLAIKRIHRHLCADERFAAMFVAEANICASLRHADIAQVFDLGRIDGRLYIAMEYVEGLDLHAMLRACTRERIRFPPEFAFFVLHEAGRGLAHAHRACDAQGRPLGIVHRDLSPTNLLLSLEGEVKLCDFGIARATGPGGDCRTAGAASACAGLLEGKAAYMSPEQARGEEVDARSDMFAFGILAWELLAGRRLYRGADEIETLRLAMEGDVPPLPDRGLPRHDLAAEMVARATARDPGRRYRTADEMHDALVDVMVAADIMPNQMRFARYLRTHFGDRVAGARAERERAASLIAPIRHRPPPLPGAPPGEAWIERRAG